VLIEGGDINIVLIYTLSRLVETTLTGNKMHNSVNLF